MKILLVNPTRLDSVLNTGVKLVHSVPKSLPPVNLLYVAGPIVRDGRHSIEILDAVVEGLSIKDVCRRVEQGRYDVVGIPLYTLTMREVKKLCVGIRKINPRIHICLGGPHVDLYPTESLDWPEVDTIIMGYAEHAFAELVDALESGRDLERIPGVGCKKADGTLRISPRAKMSREFELDFELPYDLLPYKEYASVLCKSDFTAVVVTSRGCPFSCHFCTNSTNPEFSFRKVGCVVKELRALKQRGFRELMMFDETFNLGAKRVIEICKAMIDNGIEMRWSARCTTHPMTEEMVGWMKAAGCRRIHLGIESGSDRVLKLMNKKTTVEKSERAVQLIHKNGIEIVGYFLLGYPGETLEEIQETVAFSRRLPLEFAQYSVFTPMPGTIDYFSSMRSGLYSDFYRSYTKNPLVGEPEFHFNDELIPRAEKLKILQTAYKKFYFSPTRVLRILRTMGNTKRVRRFTEAALDVAVHGGFEY
jgi:radical SAM superfamily enzyme YgiQ (UPF0313 family)